MNCSYRTIGFTTLFVFTSLVGAQNLGKTIDEMPSVGRAAVDIASSITLPAGSKARENLGIFSYDLLLGNNSGITVKAFDQSERFVAKLALESTPHSLIIQTETNKGIWKAEFHNREEAGTIEHVFKKEWLSPEGKVVDEFSVATKMISDRGLNWADRVIHQVFRYNGELVIRNHNESLKSNKLDPNVARLLDSQKSGFGGREAESIARVILGDKDLKRFMNPSLRKVVALLDVEGLYRNGKLDSDALRVIQKAEFQKDLIAQAGCVGACGALAICTYTGCGGGLACVGCASAGTSCVACVSSYINGGGGSGAESGVSPTEQIRDGDWNCYRADSNTIICTKVN